MSRHVTDSKSKSLVNKEGWLCLREDLHIRWFVLKGNLLFYYERSGITEPIGVIILEGCNIDFAKDDTLLFCFKIEFFGPNNGSYTLGANSQESMEQWMKSLKAASFNCVKSIVANLEKSLNYLEGSKLQISHPIKMIEPKQTNESLSSENLSQPSTSGLRLLNYRVPHGVRSRSPSPNRKIRGYIPSITFKTLHIEFGKLIIKDRNKRLRNAFVKK